MTMTSWYAATDYHNHDDDDNDWLCIIFFYNFSRILAIDVHLIRF